MIRLSSNRKICTYEDFTVFEGDFRSICSSWLTDTAVNFGAVWLKNEILGREDERVCIVYAFMCEIIKHSAPSNNDTGELLSSVKADPDKWCAFILNDNPDPTVVSGGCHWTLLLHDPVQKVLWQLDPMSDSKPHHCLSFFQRIQPFLKSEYKVLQCPKMSVNGSCGIYVLEYLHLIFEVSLWHFNIMFQFIKSGKTDLTTMCLARLNDRFATERRLFYCNVLKRLAEEQGKDTIPL